MTCSTASPATLPACKTSKLPGLVSLLVRHAPSIFTLGPRACSPAHCCVSQTFPRLGSFLRHTWPSFFVLLENRHFYRPWACRTLCLIIGAGKSCLVVPIALNCIFRYVAVSRTLRSSPEPYFLLSSHNAFPFDQTCLPQNRNDCEGIQEAPYLLLALRNSRSRLRLPCILHAALSKFP